MCIVKVAAFVLGVGEENHMYQTARRRVIAKCLGLPSSLTESTENLGIVFFHMFACVLVPLLPPPNRLFISVLPFHVQAIFGIVIF